MARYVDTDKLKNDILMKYKKHWEVPCSSEDRLIQTVVADLRVLIEKNTTADVAPRAEVAREIFEEIERYMMDFTDVTHTAYKHIGTATFAHLKKKYTEGEK